MEHSSTLLGAASRWNVRTVLRINCKNQDQRNEVIISVPFQAGQTAVITGAALGIGRTTAGRLAKEGLRVVMIDQASAALTEAADEVAAIVGAENALASPTDVTDVTGSAALATEVEHRFDAQPFFRVG